VNLLRKWETTKNRKICLFKNYYLPILYGAEIGTWTKADIRLMATDFRYLRIIEIKTERE
jgi:hypothetical protein